MSRQQVSGLGITALLSLGTLAVLTTLVTLDMWLDMRREQASYIESLNQQVSILEETFDEVLPSALSQGDISRLDHAAREIARQDSVNYVLLYDSDGKLLVDTRQVGPTDGDVVQAGADVTQGESTFTAPISLGRRALGTARVSLSTAALDTAINQIIARHSLQGLILVMLGLLLSLLCARYITQPIRHLARAAQNLGEGEEISPSPVGRSDEIGELARALQDMNLRIYRNKAELQKSNEELETTVREQTVDLTASHEKLALETAQREVLQGQVIQYQKMESVGRLAGGIAHDLNNLLTPIIGFTQLSISQVESGQLRENLEQVSRAATRASNLIKQLLAFSRPSFIKPEVIHPNDLVADTGTMLRRLIGEDIELVLLLGPDVKPINADPCQVEQVLMNLAVNARDALPEGGKIVIETSCGPEESRRGERVMLSVSDNGCGMADEVKAHIFEPFYTTKEQGKGTGLGLATCYDIVEQLGGQIEVESEVGQGTTIRVYIPVVNADLDESGEKDSSNDMANGTGTVLLVEDEPLVRTLVSTILKEQGYNVLEAGNGEEALRIAEERADGEIRLLLTDVVMPQMGGMELSRRFSSRYPHARVLLMSGYNDEIACSNDEYLFIAKPFTPADLSRKVREALSVYAGAGSTGAVR